MFGFFQWTFQIDVDLLTFSFIEVNNAPVYVDYQFWLLYTKTYFFLKLPINSYTWLIFGVDICLRVFHCFLIIVFSVFISSCLFDRSPFCGCRILICSFLLHVFFSEFAFISLSHCFPIVCSIFCPVVLF